MAKEVNLTPFNSPSPLLAHQYDHSPAPAAAYGGAANPCGFVLTFTDLSYSVKRPKRFPFFRSDPEDVFPGTRMLLDSVSGEVRTGEILAVLGASGSGKTTLIDALANRIERASLRGTIAVNGERLEGRLLRAISAYVMQDDLMFPMLTVEETLMFAAEVRLPRSVSKFKKKERVQALIDQLDLRSAAKTIIGDEGHRGVSGGERRRVSIGSDIVHDPVLLFLDEPTSGLDSTSAFIVAQVLQRIARSGSMVIMSVHQPSYRILGLIDRLIFLSRGQTVYSGPPHGLTEFLAAAGSPVPEGGNPAEFALDLVCEMEDTTPDGVRRLVASNSLNHHARPAAVPCFPLQEAVRNSIANGKLVSGEMMYRGVAPASYANPIWVEVLAITKRALLNMSRTPEIMAFRIADMVVTGFLLATIFWRLRDTPEAMRERISFIAITITAIFFTSADTLAVFIQEKYIYLRETAFNAYRCSSYVLSNAVITFLPLVILAITLVSIIYFAVGLAGGIDGFVFFFLTILATFWAASGFVTFISGVLSHVVLCYTISAAVFSYFLLLSGFFINRNRIPSYWIWLHYISLVKYPYEALMTNEFSYDLSKCFSRGVQMFDGTLMGSLPTARKEEVLAAIGQALGMNIGNDTCIITGSDVLQWQRVDQLGKWNSLSVIVAWGFFFRLLFYFSLLWGSRSKRE
ncbi:ABC transporter G family member 1-like [Zingiber officinale]|uniref:ABC transporter G family member 5 n=1 Tax=Zingiber officinale TaxID=94328 RepID=A0A8J5EE30_ZINOF|nr:ABC transporter G family member 1-like [Zingiber officinale]KAG6473644.1 hypothetical protein ZIOFF_067561 [Zingiber officinale]